MGVLVRDEELDGVLPQPVPFLQKNFKKKPFPGGSTWSRALTSPFRPWLRRTVPRRRTSAFLDDFEVEAAF
jgi:hypothetical protein